jgi:hypothetical protein
VPPKKEKSHKESHTHQFLRQLIPFAACVTLWSHHPYLDLSPLPSEELNL